MALEECPALWHSSMNVSVDNLWLVELAGGIIAYSRDVAFVEVVLRRHLAERPAHTRSVSNQRPLKLNALAHNGAVIFV